MPGIENQVGDEFQVDCEYNRDGQLPKELHWRALDLVRTDDDQGSKVYPDIIVHRRGTRVNLLVIEAKKAGGDLAEDDQKLLAFMTDDHYQYRFGVRMLFVTGGVPDIVVYRIEPADPQN